MDKLRVWVNFDANEVPLEGLRKSLGNDSRFEYIEKRIVDYEKVMDMAQETDIIINTFDKLGEQEISRIAGRTRFIMRYGTGYEKIDVASATKHGIPVANCPGANAPPVAELALLHMLNCGRNFSRSIQGSKKGIWPGNYSGNELDGKTVGLLGFGNIARHLARMLCGFNVNIITYDPYLNQAATIQTNGQTITVVQSIEQLFSESQIISIHVPLTPDTRGLVNARVLSHAQDGLILINTSRGGVVDEPALLDALNSGKVRKAGLDVLVEDPPSTNNLLLNHPSTTVTSHIAASTYESEMRTQAMIYETIDAFLSGKISNNVINKNELMRRSEYARFK
ncbi:MAG: 3-phosphoglycerate dehydrogenase [Clostridia bacterium]|nr:3-phosphoglycerate dehydrogenase [Clostridia bacterium]